jgi:hypothetical protein
MASSKYMKSPVSQASAAVYTLMNKIRTLLPDMGMINPALDSGTAAETSLALEYILGWDGCTYYADDSIYAEGRLIALLDDGNIVIASRSGHAYLIYGYSYNTSLGNCLFNIYDPWYDAEWPTLTRTYAWICDGDNGHYSEPRDGRKWEWVVTYRIGEYYDITMIG